jgi:RNA ligase (TIGR02306 family)
MRKLVTLRKVSKLTPIEGADVIELAHVDGWQCVVKKNEFEEGDWGIYFEIDSMIPHKPWNDHLFKNQKDIDKGFLRIKTIKLRGQLSQGLMLPLPLLLDYDLTDAIGVEKYEPPIPQDLSAKSRFPSWIQKTDEERIQNLVDKLNGWMRTPVYITEKLDGSSVTCYVRKNEEGEFDYGICSRNLELKVITVNDDGVEIPVENKFVSTAKKLNVWDKMIDWCQDHQKDVLVLQGELIGEGVQGNIYKLRENTIRFFTAQDGGHGRLDVFEICEEIDLPTVPMIENNLTLDTNFEELLHYAQDKSVLNNNQEREGIVIRAMDNSFSFKVISNKYLLKQKD